MASVDGVERQRPALPPISHLDLDTIKSDRRENHFPPINTINTSTAPMGSPNHIYSGPPPPYTYAPTSSTSAHPGYISPPESTTRRSTREEERISPRKSLPSIHEALGESKGLPPFTSTSQNPPLSTPSTTISQHFPDAPKGPSNPFSTPSFRENPFSSQMSSGVPQDLRTKELHATNPTQSPQTSIPPSFHSGPAVSASSTFTARAEPPPPPARSPDLDQSRHSFQSLSRPPPSTYRDETFQLSGSSSVHEPRASFTRGQDPSYDHTIKRHIDVHEAARDLTEIREISARNADASHVWIQRYQQGNRSGFFQDSFPGVNEIDEMMRHSQMMMESLARVREVVMQQQTALSEHRARFARGPLEDDYHTRPDGYEASGFSGGDAKKRRGKAAPPGRCHSCNRAETPEWRRGPDGARTLCNACGLHYAKLTRKIGTNKASQIRGADVRPKSLDLHP